MNARRALRFALLALGISLGIPSAARAQETSARDLVDPPASEPQPLRAPPVPREYVVARRGAVEIAYLPAIEAQVRSALAHADDDARAIAAQLGLTVLPTLDVRLVPDPNAMRLLSPVEAPPPAYAVGVAYPALGLALVSASAPESWEASDVRRVLRHELSHLLLAAALSHRPVPRWLSEGIAIHQAGEHSLERFRTLAVASFSGGLVPLRRLDEAFSAGPSQVNAAYAESADFVAYLQRSEGEPRFSVLVQHLREGMSLDEAARQTYGSSIVQLELEWRHDVSARFLTAPLWAGTGLLWLVGLVLMLVAFVRRRRTSRATLARWAIEESAQNATPGVLVVAPGAHTAHAGEPADVPEIVLDGERHTLH